MPTVTADEFQIIMKIGDTPDNTTCEGILDLAIDCVELAGRLDIGNLSGDDGSKTLTVTDRQRAAIFLAARAIYYGFYKGVQTVGAGNLTATTVDVMGNAATWQIIKDAAANLRADETDDWSEAII